MSPVEATTSVPPTRDLLGFIGETAQSFGWNLLFQQAQDLHAFQQDMDRLDVAVLGRFKAGKSSLLNALLGRTLLPVDVLPATAIVTRIESGDRDVARILFSDGRVEETPFQRLADYITEKGNPRNVRNVARVEIRIVGASLPSIRWVDTPGLGSIHKHNTEVSRKWLPRVGAALLAVSVDQPLSEDDLDLLKDLKETTPEILIVLTKSDLVSPSDLDSIRHFTSGQVREALDLDCPLFPVSTRPGFEKGLSELRDYLAGNLASDHEAKAQRIFAFKLRGIETACAEYLRVAAAAAQADEASRAGLVAALREEWEHLAWVDQEFENLRQDFSRQVREAIEERFLSRAGEVTQAMKRDLAAETAGWKDLFHHECRRYSAWMEERLVREIGRIGREHHETWKKILDDAEKSITRVVEACRARFADRVEKALGRKFEGARFEVSIPRPEAPTLRLDRVFDTPFELIWFLIPMNLVRGMLHRRFVNDVDWEVEKHLRRFASEWTDAFDNGFGAEVSKAAQIIRDELEMLEGMAVGRDGGRERIESALATLQRLQAETGLDRSS